MAAVFYFCAPVAGITGSSSYNDAAGVFFMLAAFYLLLEEREGYLLPAGVLAGFCYAIKLPGLMVVAGALLFLAVRRRWKPALVLAAGAALTVAPWMLHALVLTGNPRGAAAQRPVSQPLFPPRHGARNGRRISLPARHTPRSRCPGNWPWETT